MRLSVVFELLLVFLFLAFAAARVIDPANATKNVAKGNKKTTALRQGPPNRYCACTSRMCNCCRDFSLPVVPIKGPGCASIMYVQRDTMMVTMSFGDRVLSNTTLTGKTPKPVCMALPGGISQFCGRVYGISRKGDQFRACLGLELRALDDIEAALRVSCFKFGPKGVKLESAPPVPVETGGKDPEDDDDDDDYDLEDDDDDLIGFGDDEDDGASSEDNEVDSDSVDYAGFSVLGEDLLGTLFSDDSGGGGGAKRKKPNKKTARPQTVAPKVSTTTRRPILPVRRRSTARPEKATSRPILNRLTKRPASSTAKPVIIKKPSSVVTQTTVFSTSSAASPVLVTKLDQEKVVTKAPATTTPHPLPTTVLSESVQSSETTVVQTEQPITFTIPTQKVEVVKNEIKIPQTDLAKVEAVAAIAQQDVTSGVISSTSITSEETEKPQEAVTVKYAPSEVTTSYVPPITEKIMVNSVKFVPTTVVTSRPSAELVTEEDSLDGVVHTEIVTNSGIKNRITTQAPASEEESDEEESEEDDDGKEEEEEEEDDEETAGSNKIDNGSLNKKGNFTVNLKKQPVKNKHGKPEEESDDEEDDDDLLEGVLSDNEEAEEDEEDDDDNQTVSDKNEEEEEEEEEAIQNQKPTKVSIKKKPSEDSDEEEEEEEDILDVLADDDDEEESEDEEDDEDADDEKNKKKVTTRRPTTQTRRPTTTTEKVLVYNATENYIVYKQPPEKVTEKVIIYQEPENKVPDKVFIYKQPATKPETTENVIFYGEPVESVTQKFVIYRDPPEKMADTPTQGDEVKEEDEEEEEAESDDDSSEELSDEEGEKHTLVASIVKPGFSNKYAEEHDLTESDDLDIEDAEDDGNDFEEDRKLKQKPSADAKPKILTLSDLIGQRKKHYDSKPISTSRTHRRMNLDRLLPP